MPPPADLTDRDGLRLFTPAASLLEVPDGFFVRHPVEAQVALAGIRDASDVLGRLLEGGRSTVAGRLAGAFRRIGRADVADEILATMKDAGYDVREADPFTLEQILGKIGAQVAPMVGRMEALWEGMRGTIIELFPAAPGRPESPLAYRPFRRRHLPARRVPFALPRGIPRYPGAD